MLVYSSIRSLVIMCIYSSDKHVSSCYGKQLNDLIKKYGTIKQLLKWCLVVFISQSRVLHVFILFFILMR